MEFEVLKLVSQNSLGNSFLWLQRGVGTGVADLGMNHSFPQPEFMGEFFHTV
jgi:hypothetical protein